MLLSSLPHLLLIVLSTSSLALSWHTSDTQPYTQQQQQDSHQPSINNNYPYATTQDPDQYPESYPPPPPRFNNQNGNTQPVYSNNPSSWSQYDQQYGNMGMGQCTKKVFVSVNQIIDIQTSVQYGAQLLDGVYAKNFDECIEACCRYNGCDLALYKTDGLSQTGKTCYFVHCGLADHCRMVDNVGFKAGFLVTQPDYEDILDEHTDGGYYGDVSTNKPEVVHTEPTTTEVTTPTEPPTTEAAPTTAATPIETTSTPVTKTTAAVSDVMATKSPDSTSASSTSIPDTTEEATSQATHSSSDQATDKPTSSHTSSTHSTTMTPSTETPSVAIATDVIIDDFTQATEKLDDCGRDGCEGGGIIAVSIIGTVIIFVLLVVAAMVTRRIYKMKRRKQYRNVDYLINGMYT